MSASPSATALAVGGGQDGQQARELARIVAQPVDQVALGVALEPEPGPPDRLVDEGGDVAPWVGADGLPAGSRDGVGEGLGDLAAAAPLEDEHGARQRVGQVVEEAGQVVLALEPLDRSAHDDSVVGEERAGLGGVDEGPEALLLVEGGLVDHEGGVCVPDLLRDDGAAAGRAQDVVAALDEDHRRTAHAAPPPATIRSVTVTTRRTARTSLVRTTLAPARTARTTCPQVQGPSPVTVAPGTAEPGPPAGSHTTRWGGRPASAAWPAWAAEHHKVSSSASATATAPGDPHSIATAPAATRSPRTPTSSTVTPTGSPVSRTVEATCSTVGWCEPHGVGPGDARRSRAVEHSDDHGAGRRVQEQGTERQEHQANLSLPHRRLGARPTDPHLQGGGHRSHLHLEAGALDHEPWPWHDVTGDGGSLRANTDWTGSRARIESTTSVSSRSFGADDHQGHHGGPDAAAARRAPRCPTRPPAARRPLPVRRSRPSPPNPPPRPRPAPASSPA